MIDPAIFEELASLATFEKVLELGEAPTWEEVAHAIRKLKCGKSPGPSGVSPDALKALDAEGIATLHAFIVLFWNGDNDGDFDSWRHMTLTILPKAGKKSYTTLNAWRGIMLKELLSKILSSIISTRLLKHLDDVGI